MLLMPSSADRSARTFSGKVVNGCDGSEDVTGIDKSEIASDAETARSGGRAAENTNPGELMRWPTGGLSARQAGPVLPYEPT